jgi:GDP-D-mannose dehydratase
LLESFGRTESTKEKLGWSAVKRMKDVVGGMIEAELKNIPL